MRKKNRRKLRQVWVRTRSLRLPILMPYQLGHPGRFHGGQRFLPDYFLRTFWAPRSFGVSIIVIAQCCSLYLGVEDAAKVALLATLNRDVSSDVALYFSLPC